MLGVCRTGHSAFQEERKIKKKILFWCLSVFWILVILWIYQSAQSTETWSQSFNEQSFKTRRWHFYFVVMSQQSSRCFKVCPRSRPPTGHHAELQDLFCVCLPEKCYNQHSADRPGAWLALCSHWFWTLKSQIFRLLDIQTSNKKRNQQSGCFYKSGRITTFFKNLL